MIFLRFHTRVAENAYTAALSVQTDRSFLVLLFIVQMAVYLFQLIGVERLTRMGMHRTMIIMLIPVGLNKPVAENRHQCLCCYIRNDHGKTNGK